MKIGDVIRLKSGGPNMTISYIVGQGGIQDSILKSNGLTEGDSVATWFDSKHEQKTSQFKKETVELVKM